MAAARKCDRCGKFFAPNISDNGHGNNFVRLNGYYTTGSIEGHNLINNMDLCNECAQSLKEWISLGEMKGETE